jgi:hypothetical protein
LKVKGKKGKRLKDSDEEDAYKDLIAGSSSDEYGEEASGDEN